MDREARTIVDLEDASAPVVLVALLAMIAWLLLAERTRSTA